MTQPNAKLALPVLLAAVGALILVALVTPGDGSSTRPRAVRPAGTLAPGANPAADPGTRLAAQPWTCPRCGGLVSAAVSTCPHCRGAGPNRPPGQTFPGVLGPSPAGVPTTGGPTLVAQTTPTGPAAALPSPREQNAAGKDFIEGHWLGLEVIELTPELAKEYGIAPSERGVLVDEITLEAAESGILAGDMVRAIDGNATATLRDFFLATQRVRRREQAPVEVNRRGTIETFTMRARNTEELGFAQMEAAQPIQPGALSPHRSRHKPCTSCHLIMQSGGQLPTDTGDILPNPPPIQAGATPPHADRGACNSCHLIL